MFKISDSFKWPVEFEYAVNGKLVPQAFTAKFKRLPLEEFADRLSGMEEAKTTAGRVGAMKGLLSEVLLDFEEVEFEGDRDNVRAQLIRDTTVANAMFEAYSEAISGKLRSGNSGKPLESSPE